MWKAKTWRDFISELPKEYADIFESRFEDDSDLDQPLDPYDVMGSYDGHFPPGFPPGLVRRWMPDEIIERFGNTGYDVNVEFEAKHAQEILTMLRHEGYECIDASALLSMLSFGGRQEDIEGIEKLLDATEREIGLVPNQEAPKKKIRFDPPRA